MLWQWFDGVICWVWVAMLILCNIWMSEYWKYIPYHTIQSRAMSTLPSILAAILHFHSKYHFQSPTTSCSVTRALEGAKRSFGKPSVSAKIFTTDHLTSLSTLARKPSCSFVFLRTMRSTNVNKKGSTFYNYFQLRPLDLLHKWLNIL